ncbi:hypothetical protein BGZ95_008185 [Linnemannia exigua]|uniref:Yeast cell wall synthesis Kre9/Knh1-like N-terminal domain-containing protein n=1 Tax=Linnemannia exigua TaxID=604196 RepID=A0AAD4HAN9_9FUNG|nr:hypothetical protein BGZ95_008185 [Linnemannia exigua]
MKFTTLAVVGTMVSMATAFVNPIDPWGDSKWVPGSKVTIMWDDKNPEGPALATNPLVDIFLMTGSDQQMVKLATIAEKLNANTNRNVTYIVPTVAPIGKIYFIQVTAENNVNAWTTRFTITDAAGNPGTLAPTGPVGSNPGATGAIVSGGGAATTTAGPAATSGAAGTATSGSAANPTATAAGNADKKNSASAVSGSVLSAAAAFAVGVAALMAF